MSFHVGQKVVCINDRGIENDLFERGPTKGEVYTIRNIRTDKRGNVGFRLVEIVNQPNPRREPDETGDREAGFYARRFRPVKTTSIEIFKAMLVNPPREVVDA